MWQRHCNMDFTSFHFVNVSKYGLLSVWHHYCSVHSALFTAGSHMSKHSLHPQSGKPLSSGLYAEGPLVVWAQVLALTMRDCMISTTPQCCLYQTQERVGETQFHRGVSELWGFPALRYRQLDAFCGCFSLSSNSRSHLHHGQNVFMKETLI